MVRGRWTTMLLSNLGLKRSYRSSNDNMVKDFYNLVEQQEILSIMKILLNFQRKNVVDIN